MFIKDLRIQNYKCFEDKQIAFHVPDGENKGSGLNVFIGENGNGKTTVLEAINYLTLNSFSAENKLSINDFKDYQNEIIIRAETAKVFNCKMSLPYNGCYYECAGLKFSAVARNRKSPGKLLSSPFQIKNKFLLKSQNYKKKNGDDSGKEVPYPYNDFSNSYIDGGEFNVFYFDKNRARQITTGNYKTTYERICDDLNWKFAKGIDKANAEKLLENICGEYFKNVIEIAQKGAGNKVASDLSNFFDENDHKDLKIEFLNLLHPFSNSFFATRKEQSLQQVNVKDLGSGVEIILTLLLLKSIASTSKGSVIYLIDEPELHLHPSAQNKLLELLLEESKDKQVFVSTHSPYMFKNCLSNNAGLFVFNKSQTGKIEINNARNQNWGQFPWSPSWGEINYNAYNLATVEFHNELYGYIQDTQKKHSEREMDNFLSSLIPKDRKWSRDLKGVSQPPYDVTICTYIRNKIHHPENTVNDDYTESELMNSIEHLIQVINTPFFKQL